MSKFLRPCGNEDGEFTEVGEESWPVGAWEVVIFGGWWCWWCWSGGKVEIWVRLFWYVGNSKCDAENLLEISSKLMTDGWVSCNIYLLSCFRHRMLFCRLQHRRRTAGCPKKFHLLRPLPKPLIHPQYSPLLAHRLLPFGTHVRRLLGLVGKGVERFGLIGVVYYR